MRVDLGKAGLAAIAVIGALALPASAHAAPPANDNFASAQVIGPALPISVPGSNVEATAQLGEPAVAGNPAISTVWYRWTAPANQTVVYDLCNDDFSGPGNAFITVEIYTGATLGTLVSVAEGYTDLCLVRFNAAVGQEYKIQLDYRNVQGTFNVRLRPLAPPANDNFASAQTIGPALPLSVAATNVDSTWQANEPASLGGSSSSRSVWFNWTAPSNGQVRVSACDFFENTVSGSGNLALAVYTGAAINTLVAQTPNTGNCEQTFVATSGTTYRIALSGTLKGENTFTLQLKAAPPPANDAFASAVTVGPGIPVNVQADIEFAGVEAGEPEHGGLNPYRSVWYQWTPAESARVVVRACSKDFTARVGVYTGVAVNALTPQGDEPSFAPYCQIPLDAVAGTTYRIAVSGGAQDGQYGKANLQIRRQQVPANDDFSTARPLLLKSDGQIGGSTVDSSTELSEPDHQAGSSISSVGGSVWYRWKATSSQPIILSACSKTEPVLIAVYTGTEYDALTWVTGATSGCPSGSKGGKLALAPTKGVTYRIAVASQERDFDAAFTLASKGPYATQPKYNLKKQLKNCGKIRSKKKRVRCRNSAKEKNAVLNCQKKLDSAQQSQCIKAARKKY